MTDTTTHSFWKYEEYSEWGRRIAAQNTASDIKEDLACVEYDMGIATKSHLDAINKTHSMSSNSQRRAQSRNNVEGLYEKKRALKDALDIHQFYPEKALAATSSLQGPAGDGV